MIDKVALRAMTKHLLKLAPKARVAMVQGLPVSMRGEAAYKLLGSYAADVVKRMPPGAGHGAEHVFGVTKNVRGLLPETASTGVRRRAILGALLHDVGRGAEAAVQKRVGKAVFKQRPELWHSELGGRYTKSFLRRHKRLARYVGGLKGVRAVVRAHDTDIHRVLPRLAKRLDTDAAARATYLADKLEGLGMTGARRTVAMGMHRGETPMSTAVFAKSQVPKYEAIIRQLPTRKMPWAQGQLGVYSKAMSLYGETGALPLAKAAMAVEDYAKLYRWALRTNVSKETVQRLVRKLLSRLRKPGEILGGIDRLSAGQRERITRVLGEGRASFADKRLFRRRAK